MLEFPQFIKESWIGKFVEYTDPLPTPDIFKLWSGISCIMGALERRVWLRVMRQTTYASSYVLLVAPPGVGKSTIVREVAKLWVSTNLLKLGPDAATKAAMVDELAKASRNFKYQDEVTVFHSLQLATPEFGTLVNKYDLETLNFYNKIWDCEKQHSEKLRYGEHKDIVIDYPQINMLAGTQPAYLGSILPPEAWQLGYTARLVMVYSGQVIRPKNIFADESLDQSIEEFLIKDTRRIAGLVGPMKVNAEAEEFFNEWYGKNNEDAPSHPKLDTYNVRRPVALEKVAMAVSASCADDLIITRPHMEFALNVLLDAEAVMPEIFKGMSMPETSGVMAELYNYATVKYRRMGKPVPEHMLIDFLRNKVEAFKIDSIMKHMVTSELLKEAPSGAIENGKMQIYGKRYIPGDNTNMET